jgi:hypothetical protein
VIAMRAIDPPAPIGTALTPVYVPYTKVLPQVVVAAPEPAVWVDVSSDPLAYWGLMVDLWERQQDFVILEHDVLYRRGILGGFGVCPEPWCLHAYHPGCPCGNPACRETQRNNLGCTRFRRELMQAVPDAVSSIGIELRHFSRLCDGLGANLRAAGFAHHFHELGVAHVKGEQL